MNYTTLVSDIGAFLNRQDLTDAIPTFIRLTESRLNRTIRTRNMEVRVEATIDKQFATLPVGFLEMRNIQVNSNPVTALEYLTPQEADRMRQSLVAGKPRFFSVVANRLEIIPVPAEPIKVEMVYYRTIPPLTDLAPSNWLLDRHYDVYLYGALVNATLYLKDDPSSWATLYETAVNEITVDNDRSQFQGTTPQVRGVTIG